MSPPVLRRVALLVPLLAGLAGVACALALPFAPVLARQATVTWPAAGADPQSTTALFVPYEPAELHAQIPCEVVQRALAAKRRTVVLATANKGTWGLTVIADRGRLEVRVGTHLLADTAPAKAGCAVRVDATGKRTVVAGGRSAPVAPEVHMLATDLAPGEARGMTVSARARNWFEARPTGLKLGLIGVQLLLVAGSLAMLVRTGRRIAKGRGREPGKPGRRRRRRYMVDGVVIGALGLWTFVGPTTADDGYAMVTIRNATASGDIGNYYRWFNASEAPFTLWQRIIELITPVSLAPGWLRLPSILAGLAAWSIISRGIVDPLLPRLSRTVRLRALTALAFLAWWLPYCMGVRPEPLVTLGTVAVFALLLRGTAPGAWAGGLGHLGLAALTAGLTVSVTPSGILVAAPLLVMAPRTWRTLTAGLAKARVVDLAGRLAILACVATAGITAMFGAQSWRGVATATRVHEHFGPNYAWYEELVRYRALLSTEAQGTLTKRLPVLLSLALLVTMAVLLGRHLRALPGLREVHLVTVTPVVAFALLALSPSKWSHHFGALAGLGTAFLTVAIVAIVAAARHRSGERGGLVIGLAGGLTAAVAAGIAFAGRNVWQAHTTYGMPWTSLPLSNPLIWLLPVVICALVLSARRRRHGGAQAQVAGAGAAAIVAVAVLAVSVAILLVGFTIAPFRAGNTYSLAAQNVAQLTGAGCGLIDKIEVTPDLPGGMLAPEGKRFVLGGGEPTTPWFRLPPLKPNQQLAITVAGGTGKLTLEFSRANAAPTTREPNPADKRTHALEAAAIPPGADRVRIRALDADRRTVTGPRIREVMKLTQYLAQHPGPTLLSVRSAFLSPCVRDLPVVAHGIAQSPTLIVQDRGKPLGGMAFDHKVGGSFYGVREMAKAAELPSRLIGKAGFYWGQVVLVGYPAARDAYQLSLTTIRRPGW